MKNMTTLKAKTMTPLAGNGFAALAFALASTIVPPRAGAQETAPPPVAAMPITTPAAPETPARPFSKRIGGHIGFATPLITIASQTTSISDQFTILNPIGIGIGVSENLTIDFEIVVANDVKPALNSGLVIDPGVVYNFGAFAAGLRAAVKINQTANVGLIPLINKGVVDFDGGTWFVEAAFPTFYQDSKAQFNVVFHTGVGF